MSETRAVARRVVITGLGTVNPLGLDVASAREGLREGRGGIGPISPFDANAFPGRFAGEVKGFDPSDLPDPHAARRMDRCSRFAVHAAVEAVRDGGLGFSAGGPYRRGVVRGESDVMLSGGSEAAIKPMGLGGFVSARALSTRNHAPAAASRPFDRDRDGFVLSEGAGVVLEELEQGRRRGARIYRELTGFGRTNDAHGIAAPDPEGRGAVRAIQLALEDAGLDPGDIDCINAHATRTALGDGRGAAESVGRRDDAPCGGPLDRTDHDDLGAEPEEGRASGPLRRSGSNRPLSVGLQEHLEPASTRRVS
ncbi:3-oxoacyl-[acyl-carrier-protein] synthase 2 [Aquisphaera giovannonii]|uniref:3-oxoacyl-[acyl-carrier-protein] synthase 2 n=1 Tax=Aquisphaera giovannonii TaxID=406548 RepID=A0A5B9WBP4_9BACT|nr:beta-ketoacyl synthase N-terminal-like domain-containing protein [Aquisphaera giovannonii]QEH37629.1 3-oxoacyl-[acyl-carrier-protein] synthase 2 [Aquisphaera giovannonii]